MSDTCYGQEVSVGCDLEGGEGVGGYVERTELPLGSILRDWDSLLQLLEGSWAVLKGFRSSLI